MCTLHHLCTCDNKQSFFYFRLSHSPALGKDTWGISLQIQEAPSVEITSKFVFVLLLSSVLLIFVVRFNPLHIHLLMIYHLMLVHNLTTVLNLLKFILSNHQYWYYGVLSLHQSKRSHHVGSQGFWNVTSEPFS